MLDATGYPEKSLPYPSLAKVDSFLDEVSRSPGRLRIAFSAETPSGRPIHEENLRALEESVKLLEQLGHELVEKPIALDWRKLYRAQSAVAACNSAASLDDMIARVGREPREDELEPLTWRGIHAGRKLKGDLVLSSWRTLRQMCVEILEFYENFDVFVNPVMGTPPPEIGHIDPVGGDLKELARRQATAFPFTPPANFTGQPAMSVPLCESSEGLPIGIQFTGRYADEVTLLRLAGQLEEACPWAGRRPQIWG